VGCDITLQLNQALRLKDYHHTAYRQTAFMKTKAIQSILIAPCGMNCRLCCAYSREKNVCPGCHGDDRLKSKSCALCRIKKCVTAKRRRMTYCFECTDYPCDALNHLDKRYRTKYGMSMIANLEEIKQSGMRNFIKQEKVKWACSNCGEVLCVHKENCISCGRKWH
jgi:hypothetical protein